MCLIIAAAQGWQHLTSRWIVEAKLARRIKGMFEIVIYNYMIYNSNTLLLFGIFSDVKPLELTSWGQLWLGCKIVLWLRISIMMIVYKMNQGRYADTH